jgi:hypothetical protein
MWDEIKLEDIELQTKLELFCNTQKLMNDYYESTMTVEYAKNLLDKKQNLGMRVFIYEDEEYLLTLCFHLNGKGELRLLTTAVGKYTDIKIAISIAHEKMLEVMNDYGVDKVYAVWAKENYQAGDYYYKLYSDNDIAVENGYSKAETESFSEKSYLTWWYK